MKNILIGGAWPYANGSLHIGHVAALLPGDVLARYYRSKGNQVFYVSGSDCHGTPVTIRAKQEGRTPKEISDYYHNEFSYVFEKLGFSYDLYSKTSDCAHKSFVTNFHKKLYASDYIYEKTAPQAFCEHCRKVLTDRLVKGIFPDGNAVEMAVDMGIKLLTEEEYRNLQKLGSFDLKTSSWLETPPEIRKLGGAIFGDRRYDHVFKYHNGAQSFYSSRGFRGSLRV